MQRAPNMLFSMRNLDRHINSDRYPSLFYPESYLLEGGYSKFFSEYPELCQDKYVQGTQGGEAFEQMMHCTVRKQKSFNARGEANNLKKQQSFGQPLATQLEHKRLRSESHQMHAPGPKLRLQK